MKNFLLVLLSLLLVTSVSASYFVEDAGNPIYGGPTSGTNRAYSPYVIKIGSTYHMWYGDGANARYTNSSLPNFTGATFPGTVLTGLNASQPYKFTVYYDASGWTLGENYYSQPLVAYYTDAVGSWTANPKIAVSDDGVAWTYIGQTIGVYGYPSLSPIYWLSVLFEGGSVWKAWADLGSPTIQYFTSTNGVNWTGVASDILNRSYPQAWENVSWGAISPFVYKTNGTYVMVYSAGLTNNNQAIGLAYSTDGQHFTKDAQNPVFRIEDNITWRASRTYNGYIMQDAGLLRMYFQGHSNAGNYSVGTSTSACILNADCGACQKCSAGACVSQTSSEDLKNECAASSSCASPFALQTENGLCDGAGACAVVYANVTAGRVCNAGVDALPSAGVNCAVWADCVQNATSANTYYVGYAGNWTSTCVATNWQSTGTTWNATSGYRINMTEIAPTCQEEFICVPSWSCSAFGSCAPNNVSACLNVSDANLCGDPFNGTLSTYDNTSCGYVPCVPNWTCSQYATCNTGNVLECLTVTDANTCGNPFAGNVSAYNTPANENLLSVCIVAGSSVFTMDGIFLILLLLIGFGFLFIKKPIWAGLVFILWTLIYNKNIYVGMAMLLFSAVLIYQGWQKKKG
jgi:hypothetical protein